MIAPEQYIIYLIFKCNKLKSFNIKSFASLSSSGNATALISIVHERFQVIPELGYTDCMVVCCSMLFFSAVYATESPTTNDWTSGGSL